MNDEQIFKLLLDCSFRMHSSLGPGLLESAYEECLVFELRKAGLRVERQKSMPLVYDGEIMEIGYRIDLMVESRIIVEIKSVEALNDVHLAQILTYLKLSKLHLGLLVNFNVSSLKKGIRRVII
ncbi:MAG: GxxExxY protein [Bacteroidales bacterium]|nr:GxxExxY protein [Bacteroidales bacterium]